MMANAVFIHRSDSKYEDVPAERYQFPRRYLRAVEQTVGDWIVYLEPSKVPDTRGYYAAAMVQDVVPDHSAPDMYLAIIAPGTFLDFGTPVPFRDTDGAIVEQSVLNPAGKMSGRAQSAVRIIPPGDFAAIVDRGLLGADDILPREDAPAAPGFSEDAAPFVFDVGMDRKIMLSARKVRDRNFRRTILRAYDSRCAMTGLRLINGGGRAEVEAAHIKPVEHGGPDIACNGLALSGTVHWMFDRGLISLDDDMRILVSRQVNDPDSVHAMLNSSGQIHLPKRLSERPHPAFVGWHRDTCFKQ